MRINKRKDEDIFKFMCKFTARVSYLFHLFVCKDIKRGTNKTL